MELSTERRMSDEAHKMKGIVKNPEPLHNRLLVAVPMTGLVRAEWMIARYAQITPTNWSQLDYFCWIDQFSPVGYVVADARNLCVKYCLDSNCEWLIFIDHDVVLPPNFLQEANEIIKKQNIPAWSGLYFTKSAPAEPLVYREWGDGYYEKWKMGDQVWVKGIPMGCTVIHRSLLEAMWKEEPEYRIGDQTAHKVFETPAKMWIDPVNQQWQTARGTEDLDWCNRVVKNEIFKKAGWKKYQNMKYPFMIDTNIFCKHITPDGTMYPSAGEEQYFMRNGKK